MEYQFSKIEPKWQQYWEDKETYKVSHKSDKPKYYVLDMFPYPSGAGLHVGHPLGYISSDIYARYKTLKGYNVLHPMGFDAFGLPAEQYAIQTGQHPETTTRNNTTYFKKQLRNLGFNFDWSRELATCDPEYYKWTQWIFIKLFESWYNQATDKGESIDTLIAKFEANGTVGVKAACKEDTPTFTAEEWTAKSEKEQQQILLDYRLAYLGYSEVWYCPALGTVLANDEVKEGVSERGGHPVEKRKIRQWSLRTTAYAGRLLKSLETLNWPESMKEMQRNWIGRSEGASMWFDIAATDQKFEIFTTRPDTIFGVTFMVLAPEHELIKKITTPDQQESIDKYIAYVKSRSEIERMAEKAVTGAFTGAYAIHPFSGEKIPIWISEYVLAGYGTGAIMAVPSDDDRDFAFATKFNIPIIDVIDKSDYPAATNKDKLGKMINSDFINGMEVPDAIRATIDKIEAMGIGKGKINYRLRDASYSRQRYWGEPFPIVYREEMPYVASDELPVELPPIKTYQSSGKAPLEQLTDWVNQEEGRRETDTMPGYAGSSWYFLRYMDPKNNEAFVSKEAEQYWENVDLYIGGTEHAVGHLIYSRVWHKFLYDRGFLSTTEPFKRLVNQGMIQGRTSFAYRIKDTNTFVSHGLKDQYEVTPIRVHVKYVSNDILDTEAVKDFRDDFKNAEFILEDGKYICGWEVEKMSKSKYNVVNPDDMVAAYGADCFRMFEMFLGPVEQSKPWNTDGIGGVSKFLRKFWRLFGMNEQGQPTISDKKPDAKALRILHKTIKKVTHDIEQLGFNTCVSAFMECVNELGSLKCNNRAILTPLIILMSPFAPYITEELWHALGNTGSVHHTVFPVHDEKYLKEASRQYPIQINGRVRTRIEIALDAAKNEVEQMVLTDEVVAKWIDGKTVRKFIYVPGKIINVVAK